MATTGFEGSTLLLQNDLLHGENMTWNDVDDPPETSLDYIVPSIRRAFATADDEGALLVLEIDDTTSLETDRQSSILQRVMSVARNSIRKNDLIEQLDHRTIAIGLPGSGRIGMTRVADAIRQRVAAEHLGQDDVGEDLRTTVTIGAVHTTEAQLVNLDELLLAARVNLDSARAAGRNRTNWSDWGKL